MKDSVNVTKLLNTFMVSKINKGTNDFIGPGGNKKSKAHVKKMPHNSSCVLSSGGYFAILEVQKARVKNKMQKH